MAENGLLKQIKGRGERRLVTSYLDSFKVQLLESKQHDKLHCILPSPRTFKLEGQIEFCEKLLGIK